MKIKVILGLIIVLLSIYFINYCTFNESVYDKFNKVKVKDYSVFFDNTTLLIRGGEYLMHYQGSFYKIKRRFLTKRIYSIENITTGENIIWSEKDIKKLEKAVVTFEEMRILYVSVDNAKNIHVGISWHDGCIYNFLKLSSGNTLEKIKEQYYQHYEDGWYLDKRCASRSR